MTEILGGVEELWSIRSDINQVGEEAVAKAQEENRQAKHVAQQIKKDKIQNQHFAQFLSMLLKSINNENLITAIYNTFFKTINPENNITYLRKDINTKVIIWFFIPFFLKEAEKYHLLSHYEKLNPQQANTSLKSYIHYLEKLSETYHDNIPIDQNEFINLVIVIIETFLKNIPTQELRNEVLIALYENK